MLLPFRLHSSTVTETSPVRTQQDRLQLTAPATFLVLVSRHLGLQMVLEPGPGVSLTSEAADGEIKI